MSLETPNRVHAATTILVEGVTGPIPDQTLNIRSSIGLRPPVELNAGGGPAAGVAFEMITPDSNDEGSVYVNRDPNGPSAGVIGWISPLNRTTGNPGIDALGADQLGIVWAPDAPADFRFYVLVFGQQTIVEPIAGEPLAP